MEFQALPNTHSVYHNFRCCQPTFFKLSSMFNYRRSLFNHFTTSSKNVNTKIKKPSLFFGDGWYCFGLPTSDSYTISPPTHSQFVNVSQRLICVYLLLIMLIYIIDFQKRQYFFEKFSKTSILFWKILYYLKSTIKTIYYQYIQCGQS